MDLNSYGLDGFGFDDFNVPSISPPHNAFMNYGNENQVVATTPPQDIDLNFDLNEELINMDKIDGFGCDGGLMNSGFEMFNSTNSACVGANNNDCGWLGDMVLLENLKTEDTMDFSQFSTVEINAVNQSINAENNSGDFIVPNVDSNNGTMMTTKKQTKRRGGGKKNDMNIPKIKAPQTRTTGRAKPKKTRKRKRRSHLEVHAETCITFTREQLLKMTSEDFEAAVRELESERPITDDEEKEIKRQRRLIKNRESAQASRERKKREEEERQRIISDLKEENKTLKAKTTSLEDQVRSLREKNHYLEKENERLRHMENNFVEIPITDNMKTQNATIITQDKRLNSSNHKKTSSKLSSFLSISGNSNTNKAGVCLMILLLSVGLLFNINPFLLQNIEHPSSYSHGKIISDYNAMNELPIDNSHSNSNDFNFNINPSSFGASSSSSSSSNSPFDRKILGLEDMSFSSNNNNNNNIEEMEEVEINNEQTNNSYSSLINNFSTSTAANYSTETHNININNTNNNRMSELVLSSKELINLNSSQQIEIDLNSTYLICDNITQAGLPIEQNFNKPSFEFNLVIPPSALNLDSSEPALELVCNVIDVKSKAVNPIYITS